MPGFMPAARALLPRSRPSFPQTVRREPPLFVLVAVAAFAYARLSVGRYDTFNAAGYDLGIWDQAVWHYSNLEWPRGTVYPIDNLLGDHFSPIVALLGPLYWVWDDVRFLLIAQAVLVAASMVPVFLFARPRIGRVASYLLVGGNGLFWGIHQAVAFDFHEVAFAPLLIALIVYYADQARWTPFYVSVGLLLCTKESFSVFVVFVGLYVLLLGHRKPALITAGIGLAWYGLIVKVLIPAIGGHAYGHWNYHRFGESLPEAIRTAVKYPGLIPHLLHNPPQKVNTILYLFVPFLALVVYSPLIVLAIPLILERMLADAPNFWGRNFHYSLTIAPILAMGAADGLRNVLGFLTRGAPRWVAPAVAIGAMGLVLYANYELAQRHALWATTKAGWGKRDRIQQVYARAVEQVPDDVSVAAQDLFIPHLSHRAKIQELAHVPGYPEYIVLSTKAGPSWPAGSLADLEKIVDDRRPRYRLVFHELGVKVWQRRDLRPPPGYREPVTSS